MADVAVDGHALVGVLLTIPIAVFLHEVGHALPVIAAGGRAEICIGDTVGRSIRLGALTVTVGFPVVSAYGRCRWDGVDSRTVRQLTHLGGPAMTALVAVGVVVALGAVRFDVGRTTLQWVLSYQVAALLVTLMPIEYPSWWGRYGGSTSDGYKFLQTLRRRST